MIKMAKLMTESQFRLADADSLYTATQLLFAGHLPHFFHFSCGHGLSYR